MVIQYVAKTELGGEGDTEIQYGRVLSRQMSFAIFNEVGGKAPCLLSLASCGHKIWFGSSEILIYLLSLKLY